MKQDYLNMEREGNNSKVFGIRVTQVHTQSPSTYVYDRQFAPPPRLCYRLRQNTGGIGNNCYFAWARFFPSVLFSAVIYLQLPRR